MKQLKVFGLFMFSIILLVGCSSTEEVQSKTFRLSSNGIDSEITLTYEEDGSIIQQDSKITTPYDVLGVTNDAEAEELLQATQSDYQDLSGVTQSYEVAESSATVNLSINFTELNEEQLQQQADGEFSANILNIDQVEQVLLQQGFELVE